LRQVKILDWFYAAFHRHRDEIHLIRYEDFITNPDMLRRLIAVPEDHVFRQYQSMNKRPEYNFEEEEMIRDYLRQHTQFVQHFYLLEKHAKPA
jgi:hypothetical protein